MVISNSNIFLINQRDFGVSLNLNTGLIYHYSFNSNIYYYIGHKTFTRVLFYRDM